MDIKKNWKVVTAAVVFSGVGLGAAAGATPGFGGDDTERIDLRSARSATTVATPAPVAVDDLEFVDNIGSPDGESIDSPLQSPDDSPDGADSVDTPGEGPNSAASPDGESIDSPLQSPDDSPDGADSIDTPEPMAAPAQIVAPAPIMAPAPAPAPAPRAQHSVASPASVQSAASPASVQSADSPD